VAENVYECMFIFNANAYTRNPTGASNSVEELVKSNSGELLASRLWNEQKLAYPIKGHRKGAYWLTYFRMDSNKMVKFNRACQLNDMVLRHLAIKLDPRLVDPMVAVAKGEALPEPAPAEETKAKVAEKKTETKTETVAAE
jgi:small subunit ribosomal protein S6